MRSAIVSQISAVLDGKCTPCAKRGEISKLHGGVFAKVDNYCLRECSVGKELQQLGSRLGKGRVSREARKR